MEIEGSYGVLRSSSSWELSTAACDALLARLRWACFAPSMRRVPGPLVRPSTAGRPPAHAAGEKASSPAAGTSSPPTARGDQAALPRRLAARSRSYVACRFIQSLADVPRASARSRAASAVTPRLPWMSSLKRARVHPIFSANAVWVMPEGWRKFLEQDLSGMERILRCPQLAHVALSGSRRPRHRARRHGPSGRPHATGR